MHIAIDPFNPAIRKEIMGLARKDVVANRWVKRYIFSVVDEFPLCRRQGCDNFMTTTASTGVGAYRIFHTNVEHSRLQLIREVLYESRTQSINLHSDYSFPVRDGTNE